MPQPVGPIGVGSNAGYPQYGVGGGTPGSSAGWKTVKASNLLQKQNFMNQGYLVWFPTAAAANSFISSESSTYSSGTGPANPLAGVADIGDFFHRLTESATWVRVGEVGLGVILLYAGVKALTQGSAVAKAGSSAVKPVKKVAKVGASVAVPEARLAARTTAKRVAPKATAKVASHRAQVKKYGAKTPYSAPAPRPPTQRVTHIYHHTTPKPVKKRVGP
jgi:hypothetical protein